MAATRVDHAVPSRRTRSARPAGSGTDVIVRESNIGTRRGDIRPNLPNITARARVELGQITGLRGRLPFVNETGDQIECVWAQFVRARDGSSTGFTVTPSNPILLTGKPFVHVDGQHHQPAVHERRRTTSRSEYWRGEQGRQRALQLRHRQQERAAARRGHGTAAGLDRLDQRLRRPVSRPAAECRARAAALRPHRRHVRRPRVPLHREHRSERDLHRGVLGGGRHGTEPGQGSITVQPTQEAGSGIAPAA